MSDTARVTVRLTATSVERVERLAAKHEDTKTDTINRAIALYDMLDTLGELWTREADGSMTKLVMLR